MLWAGISISSSIRRPREGLGFKHLKSVHGWEPIQQIPFLSLHHLLASRVSQCIRTMLFPKLIGCQLG